MMKKIIPVLAVGAILAGCKKETAIIPQKIFLQIEKASWFIGNWENSSREGILLESWKRKTTARSSAAVSSFRIKTRFLLNKLRSKNAMAN
ncbi:hypothetical protein [Flavobacterium sp. 3HN19-14]|uniref:hypothetical protein n=1 Tax=Flavobacterium sp. 3HN19-14 TaxID=3448133 RepID=UPI003EE0E5A4